MKIIISHDVDHITAWEHIQDFFLPKYFARSFAEFCTGFATSRELFRRFINIKNDKLNNIDELMAFDKAFEVPSTFFIAVNNGKGLRYSIELATYWIRRIFDNEFDVGVHGIAYNDYTQIRMEHDLFLKISGVKDFGIRMHYLRSDYNTIRYLQEAGYLFDASVYGIKNLCGKFDGIWEFPLHIMDVHLFHNKKKWQDQHLCEIKEATKHLINKLLERNVEYGSILFHDCYFTESFKTKQNWYAWVIEYLKKEGFRFVSYKEAIQEVSDFR
jgi:peptidoglycan/xylan/chitin deacetylase (PgdA/CDA1 family)